MLVGCGKLGNAHPRFGHRPLRGWRWAFGATAVVVFGGCASDSTSPIDPDDEREEVQVATIVLTPSVDTLNALGHGVDLQCLATDLGGAPVSGRTPTWSSSAPDVATVSAGRVTGVGIGVAQISARIDDVEGSATVVVRQIAADLAVSPDVVVLDAIDATALLAATVVDSAGRAIPGPVPTWSGDDPEVASVDEFGVVTAHGEGTTAVTARFEALIGSAEVVVEQAVATFSVEPDSLTLLVGGSTQLEAVPRDSGGTPVDDVEASWISRDPAVASVGSSGAVNGAGEGTTWIVGEAMGMIDSTHVKVINALAEVSVAPSEVTLTSVGAVAEFEARGIDADGNEVPGVQVVWAIAPNGVAMDLGNGRFEAKQAGIATVTARADGFEGSARLTVDPLATDVIVSPGSLRFRSLGESQTLFATVRDDGGTVLSRAVSWRTRDADIVTVSGARVTSVGEGRTWVVAEVDGVSDSASVEVDQVAVEVVIPEGDQALALGRSVELSARVTDAEGTSVAGAEVTWSSSDPSVASVVNGEVTANGGGTAQIRATFGAFFDVVEVTVDPGIWEGDLVIDDQAMLDSVQAIGVRTVTQSVIVVDTDLESLDGLESIESIGWTLFLLDNEHLRDVSGLSGVKTIGYHLEVRGNPALESLAGLSSVRSIGGNFELNGNPSLDGSPMLPALETLGLRLDIHGENGPRIELPALTVIGLDANLSSPNYIFLPETTCVQGVIRVLYSPLKGLSMPELRSIGDCGLGRPGFKSVLVEYSSQLEVFEMPKLEYVVRDFDADLGRVTTLDLGRLREVDGTLLISGSSITSLDLSSLESTEEALALGKMEIPEVRLPSLTSARGLTLSGLPEVTTVAAPGLVSMTLTIKNVPKLTSLDMPDFEGGQFYLEGSGFETLELPRYRVGSVYLIDNPELTSVDLPRHVEGLSFVLEANPLLSSVNNRVWDIGYFRIIDNDALTSLDSFSTLTKAREVIIENNGALGSIEGLQRLGSGTDPILSKFVVRNNSPLTDAQVQALLDLLEAKYAGDAVSGETTIAGNGSGSPHP